MQWRNEEPRAESHGDLPLCLSGRYPFIRGILELYNNKVLAQLGNPVAALHSAKRALQRMPENASYRGFGQELTLEAIRRSR